MEDGDDSALGAEPTVLGRALIDCGVIVWQPRELPRSVLAVVVMDRRLRERAVAVSTRVPGRMVAAVIRHAAGHAAVSPGLVLVCHLGVCFAAETVLPWAAVLP